MIRPGQSPETVFGENNNLPFAGVGKWLITGIGMNMSGKDVLRLLLISYGFCRNIEISTYIGDGGWIGYEVSASNDDGIEYYEVDCEGLLFHIYEIQKFMRYENIEPRSMLGNFSNKHLLSDDSLNKLLNMSENKNYCKTNPYE